jgi:hypothetical protein
MAAMGHIIGNAKIPDRHAEPGIASLDADRAPALAVLSYLSCGLIEFQRARHGGRGLGKEHWALCGSYD